MFSNLNWWEIIGLALLALFIFGPERLPKVISDGLRMLRSLRDMARNATTDLSRELGTEVRLEDLHPKTFIRKHLLSEEDEAALRRPFDDAYRDVKEIATDVNGVGSRRPQEQPPAPRSADQVRSYDQVRPLEGQPRPYHPEFPGSDARGSEEPRPYDADAT